MVERLTGWHRPILWWYRRQGHPVAYLHAAPSVNRWIEQTPWLTRLELREPVHWGHHPGGDLAFEVVERSFEAAASHPLIRYLTRLYGTPDIHLAFKKSLCAELERRAYYVVLRARIAPALGPTPGWVFIPSVPQDDLLPRGHAGLMDAGGAESGRVRRPLWIHLLGAGQRLLARVTWAGLAAVTMGGAALAALTDGRSGTRQNWTYAVAIVSPAREFANDIRGVGFLLDGTRIHARNTIFVPLVPLPPGAAEALAQKGLMVARLPAGTRTTLGPVLRGTVLVARYTLGEPWITRAAAHLLREYGRWAAFLARHHADHFVTYADFSFRQIGRNILLRRDGTSTWYYADSVNTADTLSGGPHRNAAWGWLYYDTFVSWCERFSRYFQLHPQRISRYVEVGCLWSEHVRLLRSGEIPSGLAQQLPWKGWDRRVIAVFDSTYRDDTATTYRDGTEFARGILRLLDERPDIVVLWKEKKPRSYHRGRDTGELTAAYDELARHPRCLFTGHGVSASEPLALCELAISFPFTSTTLEALGAGVKAIFFDPSGNYRDSYYAGIEGLVAHGYPELRRRVDELLDRTPREAYQAYLERHIKGAIDLYVDGFALSRFRALLAGERLPAGVPAVMRS